MINVIIGCQKLDENFKVPIPEDLTLEQFKNCLEKIFGHECNLNITKYALRKHQKIKDLIKDDSELFILKNENLGHLNNHWKGNFINISNSCFRDSLTLSIAHSIAEKLENSRKKQFLPKNESLRIVINPWKGNFIN